MSVYAINVVDVFDVARYQNAFTEVFMTFAQSDISSTQVHLNGFQFGGFNLDLRSNVSSSLGSVHLARISWETIIDVRWGVLVEVRRVLQTDFVGDALKSEIVEGGNNRGND